MSAHYINKNEAKHLLILLFCKIHVALGEEAGIYSGSYIINRIICKILNYCIAELISQFYSLFSAEPVVVVAERPSPANSHSGVKRLSSSLSGVKDGNNKTHTHISFQIR